MGRNQEVGIHTRSAPVWTKVGGGKSRVPSRQEVPPVGMREPWHLLSWRAPMKECGMSSRWKRRQGLRGDGLGTAYSVRVS